MVNNILEYLQNLNIEYGETLIVGLQQTLYMVVVSTIIAYIIGLPLGILSEVTRKGGLNPIPVISKILDIIINLGRSIPFIILMVAVLPLTRSIIGTTIGEKATCVPLIIAAIPFVARMVENSLKEIDSGVIEAARAMGASNMEIIFKVMLVESMPSLVLGASLATITIVGYTAMAGAIGGGGLGDIAIRYGYHRRETDIMVIAIIILVAIVQIIQTMGELISKSIDKRGKGDN